MAISRGKLVTVLVWWVVLLVACWKLGPICQAGVMAWAVLAGLCYLLDDNA